MSSESPTTELNASPNALSRSFAALFGVSVAFGISYLIAVAGSVEVATGLGMLSVPTLGAMCWSSGRISIVFQLFFSLLFAMFYMILTNVFGTQIVDSFLPEMEVNRGDSYRNKVAMDHQIQEAKTDEEIDNILNTIEQYKAFVIRRKKTLICALALSVLATALIWYDLYQSAKSGTSYFIPMAVIGAEPGWAFFSFPSIFVLVSIPLCIVFANYQWPIAAAILGASIYLGTAISLFFCARNPAFQFWVIPLLIFTIVGGASLLTDWVELKVEEVTNG